MTNNEESVNEGNDLVFNIDTINNNNSKNTNFMNKTQKTSKENIFNI